MVLEQTPSPAATYRLLADVLAAVPRSDGRTCARLLVAMARDALDLGDRATALDHLSEALMLLSAHEATGDQ